VTMLALVWSKVGWRLYTSGTDQASRSPMSVIAPCAGPLCGWCNVVQNPASPTKTKTVRRPLNVPCSRVLRAHHEIQVGILLKIVNLTLCNV